MNTSRRKKTRWQKTIPKRSFDALVVGSGMGGMTAAALLAKAGRRVLVLEQHYVPGGFTHSFKRPHYEWDVGVHAVGQVSRRSFPGRLLHHLTDGTLKWASLGSVYDEFYFPDGVRLDFPDSPGQFRKNLLAAFPDEGAAIDAYLEEVRSVSKAMSRYYLSRLLPRRSGQVVERWFANAAHAALRRTTQEVVSSLTDNPRLRSVFAAQWGYYGAPPSRASFAIQALVVRHFQWGAYYPVGGSRRIAECLLGTVESVGGATAVRADVERIVLEDHRAVGVRLATGETIRAPIVVSALSPTVTVNQLLPEDLSTSPWAASLRSLRPSSAHVCLYLGFKGDIRAAGAGAANKWFYEDWDTERDAWLVDDPNADAPVLYCSFPSLKDPEHVPGPEQRHTGEVVTFVPYQSFSRWEHSHWKRREDDYDEFKETLKQRMLSQFLAHMPGLEKLIDVAELSTPLSTNHFVRPLRASIYGLEPTPERFLNPWLRPRSPIPGLFFAGSDVATVGVVGAMMGGVLGAMACDPWRCAQVLLAARH